MTLVPIILDLWKFHHDYQKCLGIRYTANKQQCNDVIAKAFTNETQFNTVPDLINNIFRSL